MIETIYNDFTTKLLPKVAEGIQITKDYFTDLFGRYIKYLIIMDSIYAFIAFIFLSVSVYFFVLFVKKCKTQFKNGDYISDGNLIGVLVFSFAVFISGIVFFYYAENLVKAIYVPEVRVYEQITQFISK